MIEFTEYDGGQYAVAYFQNGATPAVFIIEDPKKRGFGWLKCPA
ncbi:hypothetical protein [Azospirillum sp. B21]|nr:hypothetical protein [Azospirillum sp. B21]